MISPQHAIRDFRLPGTGAGTALNSNQESFRQSTCKAIVLNAPWLKKLLDEARPHRLSQPSLETLSIIALRQPISRADIAAIRGVEVDGVIKTLLERDLITIVGRNENLLGKPLLYGTTQRFLEHFGLRGLDDMPKAAELRLQAAALRTAEQKAEEKKEEPAEAKVSHEGQTTEPAQSN